MSVEMKADGSRTVHLFIPLEVLGSSITIRAVTLDDVVRWQTGTVLSPMALLAQMTGTSESMLGLLRYPDADRVLAEFMNQLPDAIRNDVLKAPNIGSAVEAPADTIQGAEGASPSFFGEGEEADPSLGLEGITNG